MLESEEQLDRSLQRWLPKVEAGVAGGSPFEICGRIYRYRGIDGWRELLEQAASRYRNHPGDHLGAANLLRILGYGIDDRQELYHSAMEASRERRDNPGVLICAYFLEDDALIVESFDLCRKDDRGYWRLLDLRKAWLDSDLDGLRAELAHWERKAKRAPMASNGENPSRHDMVEHIGQLINSASV